MVPATSSEGIQYELSPKELTKENQNENDEQHHAVQLQFETNFTRIKTLG
jgi:hypothetical protein